MKNSESRTRYYERTDFSRTMKSSKGRKVAPQVRRVTMNISERVYEEANELDSYMGMGYQNVLKTAMALGLTELYNQVSSHRMQKKM